MTRPQDKTELETVERLLDTMDPADYPAIDTTALARVAQLADARDQSEGALTEAVLAARATGFSWTEIGFRLRVSRQAARQKYGPLEKNP